MRKFCTILLCFAFVLLVTSCQNRATGEASSQAEATTRSSEQSQLPSSQVEAIKEIVAGVNAENYPDVYGSTANLPLIAKLYSEVCGVALEDAETVVQTRGGTGEVWRSLYQDDFPLLLVYEAPETVKAELADAKIEYDQKPIGRDGLVFVVNTKNPVDSLTINQLMDIYTGKITDWKDVGGEAGPIVAFQRNEESGSQTLFKKLLMKDIAPMKPPSALVPAEMGALIDGVAAYDGTGGAIGYSVYYYADLMYAKPDLKLLKIDGVAPSKESIKDGSYPLVNDFYGVVKAKEPANGTARLLRDFLLTDAGKKLMADANYVPVN